MMTKRSLKFPKLKLENAQTMLEFAIVFPVILLITYGIIEFGRMLYIYTTVTSAAREGARYGAAAGGDIDNPYTDPPRFAECAQIKEAVRHTAIMVYIPDSNIKISYDKGPGKPVISNDCPPPIIDDFYTIVKGDRIIVTVTAQYQPLLGSFLGFDGFSITKVNARTILAIIDMSIP